MNYSLLLQVLIFMGACMLSLATPATEIIVNKGSVARNSISLKEVRAIYSMRLRKWPDGVPVSVFVLPEGSEAHSEFCKNTLRIFPHQLKAAWERLVYSGTGAGPVVVRSEQEMIEAVAATPGAIGYIEKSTERADVQILPLH